MATPDTDKDLAPLLKKAKKKKQYFGLVLGGDSEKLIVSKKPVKSSVLKKLKKELKAKKIVQGECKGAVGGVVEFYSNDKVPSGTEKLVKRLAKEAGAPIKVEFKTGSAPG